MVPRNTFINKIRSLGFSYKGTGKRTYLYRKAGGQSYIAVPMADLLDDEFVILTLRREGLSPEEVKRFIGEACA